MAANANVILKEWQRTLSQWEFAMGHARGFDNLHFGDWERLDGALFQLGEAVDAVLEKLQDVTTPAEQIPYPELYKERERD